MKKIWEKVDFKNLEIGQFVIIEFWESGRNFILAKVLKNNQISEISECPFDRARFDNIENCFPLRNFATKRKLIEKDGILRLKKYSPSNNPRVTSMFIVDTEFIESIVEKELEKRKEKLKKIRQENKQFRKTMKMFLMDEIKKRGTTQESSIFGGFFYFCVCNCIIKYYNHPTTSFCRFNVSSFER